MQPLLSWFLVALCLGVATCTAQAESLVSETELLEELAQNPMLRTLIDAPIEEARAELLAAKSLAAPSLQAEREDAGAEGVEWTWSVGWEVPWPGQRQRMKAQTEATVRATAQVAKMTRLELRLALREAFADWALAQARQKALAEHAATLETLAEHTEARAEAGEVPGITARRLRLAKARAKAAASMQEAAAASARGGVQGLIGDLADDARPLLPELPPVPEDPNLATHPEGLADRFVLESQTMALDFARHNFSPPNVELGWREVRLDGESFTGPVFGLGWTIPLKSRRRAEVNQAEAQHASAAARLDLGEVRREAELKAQRAAFEGLRKAFQTTAREDASLRHAVVLSYQLGETELVDLLDTLEALRDTNLDHLEALAAVLESHRTLERAAGQPLELLP